jgi:hypothetical protein
MSVQDALVAREPSGAESRHDMGELEGIWSGREETSLHDRPLHRGRLGPLDQEASAI